MPGPGRPRLRPRLAHPGAPQSGINDALEANKKPVHQNSVIAAMISVSFLDDTCGDETNNIPLSDCCIVSPSGRRFPSTKGLLALKSSLFSDIITNCSDKRNTGGNCVMQFEIPLQDDSDEDVELLWKHLHGKFRLVDAFEAAESKTDLTFFKPIFTLARMADKYQVEGVFSTG